MNQVKEQACKIVLGIYTCIYMASLAIIYVAVILLGLRNHLHANFNLSFESLKYHILSAISIVYSVITMQKPMRNSIKLTDFA